MSIPPDTNNGGITSWIPLTTIFTPSSGCESYFRLNGPSLVAFDPSYGLDINPQVKCAPSAVTTWWEQGRLGGGLSEHTAVSIQPLTCPDEWSTVAISIINYLSFSFIQSPTNVRVVFINAGSCDNTQALTIGRHINRCGGRDWSGGFSWSHRNSCLGHINGDASAEKQKKQC